MRSCYVVIDMEANEIVENWFIWRKTVDLLLHDKAAFENAQLKLPRGYADTLEQFARDAYAKAQEEYRQLKRAGISILGDQVDQGEHFILWKQRGETRLLRIHDKQLRDEASTKLNELVGSVAEYWNNHHPITPRYNY